MATLDIDLRIHAAHIAIDRFAIRGLAEIPRLLLAAADVKYTDDRIAFVRNADEFDAIEYSATSFNGMRANRFDCTGGGKPKVRIHEM